MRKRSYEDTLWAALDRVEQRSGVQPHLRAEIARYLVDSGRATAARSITIKLAAAVGAILLFPISHSTPLVFMLVSPGNALLMAAAILVIGGGISSYRHHTRPCPTPRLARAAMRTGMQPPG